MYKQFLDSVPSFEKEISLEGIENLLEQMGRFHDQLKVISIAGTNGKGSCTAMLSSIYGSCYRVGAFLSPYIEDYRESIRINDQMIEERQMNQAAQLVQKAYQQLQQSGRRLPTKYECLTVIALKAMQQNQADLCLMEALMGGKKDATNIFSRPLACLFTSISLDHTAYLGNSVEAIAKNKSGLIKPRTKVVINKNPAQVEQVITEVAKAKDCPVYNWQYLSRRALYNTAQWNQLSAALPLRGQYQQDNLTGVLTVVEVLRQNYPLAQADLIRGLKRVWHPGRLEHLCYHQTEYIIDGSHNRAGLVELNRYIKEYKAGKILFVIASLADKDLEALAEMVYPLADQVMVTPLTNPRSFDPIQFWNDRTEPEKAKTKLVKGVKQAFEEAAGAGYKTVVVCGSLYLADQFRKQLVAEKERSDRQE